jgi:hypothetical protein
MLGTRSAVLLIGLFFFLVACSAGAPEPIEEATAEETRELLVKPTSTSATTSTRPLRGQTPFLRGSNEHSS